MKYTDKINITCDWWLADSKDNISNGTLKGNHKRGYSLLLTNPFLKSSTENTNSNRVIHGKTKEGTLITLLYSFELNPQVNINANEFVYIIDNVLINDHLEEEGDCRYDRIQLSFSTLNHWISRPFVTKSTSNKTIIDSKRLNRKFKFDEYTIIFREQQHFRHELQNNQVNIFKIVSSRSYSKVKPP